MSLPGLFPGLGEFTNVSFGLGWRTLEEREVVLDTNLRVATVLVQDFETATFHDLEFELSTELVYLLAAAISLDAEFDLSTELDTETEA